MKEAPISLENAGGELADWVRRAQYEHTTFVVLDASKPVARLIPAETQRCSGSDLAAALTSVELTAEEASSWAEDLRLSRERLSPPGDRWQ